MADEITEFIEIDPEEVHLVGTPASKFAALMAKSSGKKKGKQMSKKKARKLAKQLIPTIPNPAVSGVNLGGRASTLSNRTSALAYVSALLDHFESRVESARAAHRAAGHAMAKERAWREVQQAQRQRLLAKMVVQEGVRADSAGNIRESRFGSPIFKEGSTYSLPDDSGLGYTGREGQAVR